MTIVCGLLLALAMLMTLLFIPVAADVRPVSGADAMGLVTVLFLSAGRALCLLVVLLILSTRGGFAWLHPSKALQATLLLVVLGAGLAMEIWSLDAATGWYGRAAKPWVFTFSILLPMVLILFAAAALDRGRHFTAGAPLFRGAGILMVLLLVAGFADLSRRSRVVARERAAHAAELEAEAARAHSDKLAALRALNETSPLEAWIDFTNDSDDEVRESAVASIKARPTLHEDLAAILRSPEPLPAMRWLWLWSHDRPAELAHALHDAAVGLPEWARRRYDDGDPVNDGDVSTACEALVVLADEFQGHGVDFRAPIEALSAFLNSRALPEDQLGSDPTYQARSMLQYWFDKHGEGN
jgi:hypothetical protein